MYDPTAKVRPCKHKSSVQEPVNERSELRVLELFSIQAESSAFWYQSTFPECH